MRTRPYLGTDLTPDDYYKQHSGSYKNPHAAGIAAMLAQIGHHLTGTVLDLGCGDGLATKLLVTPGRQFVGVDSTQTMVDRYVKETGFPAFLGSFWGDLPQADSCICSYALHLCPPSRIAEVGARLLVAGVHTLVVISPFKQKPARIPGYSEFTLYSASVGPEEKSIYGRLFTSSPG